MIPSSDLPTVSGDHRCVYRTDAEVVRAGNERLEARCQELEENGVTMPDSHSVKRKSYKQRLIAALEWEQAKSDPVPMYAPYRFALEELRGRGSGKLPRRLVWIGDEIGVER